MKRTHTSDELSRPISTTPRITMNSTLASAPKPIPVSGSTNAANAITAIATSHSSATAYVGRE